MPLNISFYKNILKALARSNHLLDEVLAKVILIPNTVIALFYTLVLALVLVLALFIYTEKGE